MFRKVARLGLRVFELADIAVQVTVGWTVAFGALMAGAAGLWAFLIEWGPLSIPAALLAALVGMITFEEGAKVWEKWRRGSAASLALLRELNRLTEEGGRLLTRYDLCARDDRFEMPTSEEWGSWQNRCEAAVAGISLEEVYGLRSQLDPTDYYNKLRMVTMRYAQRNPHPASEVLGNVARQTPQS